MLGIGNSLNGDDAAGCIVARQFKKVKKKDWLSFDCGNVPENFTGVIKRHRPELLVLVDAAEMGLEPGKIRLVPIKKTETVFLSTHSIPLNVFIKAVEKFCEKIIVIGIQPKSFSGNGLSGEVKKGAGKILRVLESEEFAFIKEL